MSMNKLRVLSIVLLAVLVALFAGCSGSDEAETASPAADDTAADDTAANEAEEAAAGDAALPAEYEDGVYFAQEDAFDERTGWKYMVILEVEGGEIVSATWEGANRDGGTSKVTRSENGEYGMVENGGAMAPWYEQAAATEAYLLETQDPTDIEYTTDAGNTDAIAGATIHVVEFFTLAEEALIDGPVGYGMWQDGHYRAEQAEFSNSGWKYTVDLTVVGGRIVAANWNGIPEDGGTLKKQRSMDGEYGMVENGGAMAPWFEQAQAAEDYLLEIQDPTAVEISETGHVDAITGATIHVNEMFELATEALEGASRG